jgi:hypothetical protein
MDAALETMIRNLEARTGRPLDAWLALVRDSGLEKHGAKVKFLKEQHGMTHGYANMVVMMAREEGLPGAAGGGGGGGGGGEGGEGGGGGVAESGLFAGKKEGLRPIWDVLRDALLGLGPDVELAPKKAYVSIRRRTQFALVQPSTASRLDLGLNLKGVDPAGRLEPAGSFNAMCSHRVRLESPDDVDAEVMEWVRAAYERAG